MTLTWNLVTKNLQPSALLQEKFRQKISKLERHLQHFPPDAVHLQIHVEKHPKRKLFISALTLRLPSSILRGEKSAADPIPAFDHAVKAVLRELSALKAGLRCEARWKRKDRRPESLRFARAPLPAGVGPQTLADSVSALLQQYYPRLVEFIRRRLRRAQLAGEIPAGAVDPHAVADEVAQQALARPERKPSSLTYPLWFYSLAREELKRRIRNLEEERNKIVSLDESVPLPESAGQDEGYDAEQPLQIIERKLEPDVINVNEMLPDPHADSPDFAAAQRDLVDWLQRMSVKWPKQEREVFEFYFLEGLEPDEIAMIEKLRLPQVMDLIGLVQTRLRDTVSAGARFPFPEGQPGPPRATR